MGSRDRRERARDSLRNKILAAAEELFAREGYESVSMRKIALKIDYSATAIYYHFKDKEELLDCILTGYQSRLLWIEEEISGRGDDSIATLRAGMRAYTDFGLANPSFYKLAFMNPPKFAAEGYLLEGDAGTNLFLNLRASVARCIREGRFRSMDVDLATQIVWTVNHGVTSLLLSNPDFPWVERDELIDRAIECAISGLRPGAEGENG